MNRLFFTFQIILYVLVSVALFCCAIQKAPLGGPKDETGPVIITTSPKNGSVNATPKVVVFNFDEYLDWKSVSGSISVSPFSIEITEQCRGKSLEVTFHEQLPEDTTIRLTLNTKIKDKYNNSLEKPFTIAFSTGAKLDTGRILGTIMMPERKPCSIALQKLEKDSFIIEYILPSAVRSEYSLENIRPGNYFLTASFSDENNVDFMTPITITTKHEFVDILMLAPQYKTKYSTHEPLLLEILPKDSTTISPDEKIYIKFSGNLLNFPIDSVKISSSVSPISSNWAALGNKWILNPGRWHPDSEITIQYDTLKTNIFIFPEDSLGTVSSRINVENPKKWKISILKHGILKSLVTVPVSDEGVWSADLLKPDLYQILAFEDRNGNGHYDAGSVETMESAEVFFIHNHPIEIRARWTIKIEDE